MYGSKFFRGIHNPVCGLLKAAHTIVADANVCPHSWDLFGLGTKGDEKMVNIEEKCDDVRENARKTALGARRPSQQRRTEEQSEPCDICGVNEWNRDLGRGEIYCGECGRVALQNAIDPIPEHKKPDDVINICYHTTPHRGLELLIPTYKALHNQHFRKMDKPVHLHVYSDFNIYGWPERNKPYIKLFDECRNDPNITYNHTLTNEQMKKIKITLLISREIKLITGKSVTSLILIN